MKPITQFIYSIVAIILILVSGIAGLYALFHGIYPLVATGTFNLVPILCLIPGIILFALAITADSIPDDSLKE